MFEKKDKIAFGVAGVIILASLTPYIYSMWPLGFSPENDDWGDFGSYIGGTLGPVCALLSVYYILRSTTQQLVANKTDVDRQLEAARQAERVSRLEERLYFELREFEKLCSKQHSSKLLYLRISKIFPELKVRPETENTYNVNMLINKEDQVEFDRPNEISTLNVLQEFKKLIEWSIKSLDSYSELSGSNFNAEVYKLLAKNIYEDDALFISDDINKLYLSIAFINSLVSDLIKEGYDISLINHLISRIYVPAVYLNRIGVVPKDLLYSLYMYRSLPLSKNGSSFVSSIEKLLIDDLNESLGIEFDRNFSDISYKVLDPDDGVAFAYFIIKNTETDTIYERGQNKNWYKRK